MLKKIMRNHVTGVIKGEVRDEVIEVRCIVGSSYFMGHFSYFKMG